MEKFSLYGPINGQGLWLNRRLWLWINWWAICLGISLISWTESTAVKPRSGLRSVIIFFLQTLVLILPQIPTTNPNFPSRLPSIFAFINFSPCMKSFYQHPTDDLSILACHFRSKMLVHPVVLVVWCVPFKRSLASDAIISFILMLSLNVASECACAHMGCVCIFHRLSSSYYHNFICMHVCSFFCMNIFAPLGRKKGYENTYDNIIF